MILISFLLFLLVFVLIGLASISKRKTTTDDYLVANRSVAAWLVALSAVATNNSGYMFIALIGYTYLKGLEAIWLMFGWVIGDFLISLIVHERIREIAEKRGVHTFGGLISCWQGSTFNFYRKISGSVSLIFLGSYAAAQLIAGGKALNAILNWDLSTGVFIGALIIFAYSYAGGIRASIWTDAAQSFVMIFAMTMLLISGVNYLGGFSETYLALNQVSTNYLNFFPSNSTLGPLVGPAIFILGWLGGGVGVIGQPHIMIRFMTLDEPSSFWKVRLYYYVWFIAFFAISIFVGMLARIILSVQLDGFDPELALPLLSLKILPDFLVGTILAGIFAATISTADSLVLSCSASLSRDFIPKLKNSYWGVKLSTAAVTILALIIALFSNETVFSLVLVSWSGLAAFYGPVIILLCLGKTIENKLLISISSIGLAVTLLWKYFGYSEVVYEILPGMIAGFLTYFLLTIMMAKFKSIK